MGRRAGAIHWAEEEESGASVKKNYRKKNKHNTVKCKEW